jgi:hypothetical protein
MLSLVVLTLISAALPVLIYYARAFAPSTDFQAVLRRDFDRAFLPGFFMLCITAVQAAAGRLHAAIPMVGEPRPQTPFPERARDSRAAR